MSDYHSYESLDFAMDPRFQRWVRNPHPKDALFWGDWIRQHPEKSETIEMAIRLVQVMDAGQDSLSKEEIQEKWQAMESIIGADDHSSSPEPIPVDAPPRKRRLQRLALVATAAILVAATAAVLWIGQNDMRVIRTDFGEVRTLTLPDKSRITLAPNSAVSYRRDWAEQGQREIWLEGEAYAEVEKDKAGKLFRVHVNEVQVDVLGTVFNINSRRGQSTVVLHEGKVRLSHEVSTDTLVMAPGDLAAYSEQDRRFVRRQVAKPADYIDWSRNEMLLNETPVYQIATMIEDRYNYQVIITDKSLANEPLSGELYTEDLDFLIEALEKTFDLKITRKNDTLIVEKNE